MGSMSGSGRWQVTAVWRLVALWSLGRQAPATQRTFIMAAMVSTVGLQARTRQRVCGTGQPQHMGWP